MKIQTLVDTGPLVALLKSNEAQHGWVVDALDDLPATGMATCEAVISEACFLLSRWPAAIDALFRRLTDGTLTLEPLEEEAAALGVLMRKYRSVPMAFADACLVRLAERHPDAVVFTLDSDFGLYRRGGRHRLALKAPFA